MMPQRDKAITLADAGNYTLYVAIEISRKSWVVGLKGPTSSRIGLHTIGSSDVEALKALIERHRDRVPSRGVEA